MGKKQYIIVTKKMLFYTPDKLKSNGKQLTGRQYLQYIWKIAIKSLKINKKKVLHGQIDRLKRT